MENYKKGIDSLVYAVCGSGKTEIVIKIIHIVLSSGGIVGFAIPRRDVVIELCERFKEIFKENNVISVYGGHTQKLEGDIICLTTHQLFRYNNYFDLLILDEIDAFPYKGNKTLEAFFKRSAKKNFILLSATPSDDFIKEFKRNKGDVLKLFVRFHRHPLPVPKAYINIKPILLILLIKNIKRFSNENKPVLIFVPTIDLSYSIYNLLKLFIKCGNYVNSKHPYRSKIIDDFKKGKYRYLVTTAVLERGVTIKNLQVVIYLAEHEVYDSYSLVQISGRVGRKKDAPEGEVIYLARKNTEEIKKSIDDIKTANKSL